MTSKCLRTKIIWKGSFLSIFSVQNEKCWVTGTDLAAWTTQIGHPNIILAVFHKSRYLCITEVTEVYLTHNMNCLIWWTVLKKWVFDFKPGNYLNYYWKVEIDWKKWLKDSGPIYQHTLVHCNHGQQSSQRRRFLSADDDWTLRT